MKKIEKLKQGISSKGGTISNQTILDDVYWLEANLRMKRGEFDQAITMLRKKFRTNTLMTFFRMMRFFFRQRFMNVN